MIWGDIGYVATGAAGAFPASNPSDVLIDLIYALKAGYRQNAVFVMNRSRVVKVMRRSAREVTHRMPERVTGIFRASVFNSRATCPNCGAFILIAHMRQTRRPRTRWSFGGKSQPEGLSEV